MPAARFPSAGAPLGLTEPQDEAFWKLQQNAVTHRFLSYLLFQLDMPLTLERLEMTLNEAASLQTLARLPDGRPDLRKGPQLVAHPRQGPP